MENIFKTESLNFYDTMTDHNAQVGYSIPDYQRNYDWGSDNISRLIADCLDGFSSLSKDNSGEAYTFLGTLILVREKKENIHFRGVSLSVVDGQQRLTTLVLIACALIEKISIKCNEILLEITDPKLTGEIRRWIEKETFFQKLSLYECALGQSSTGPGKSFPYPRIIRDEKKDERGRDHSESEYISDIARFLKDVSGYYMEESHVFPTPEKELSKNYKHIQDAIEKLSDSSKDINGANEDMAFTLIKAKEFKQSGIKDLFGEMSILSSESVKQKALAFVSDNDQIEPLIRLLLFASYVREYVIFTCVKTENEDIAFKIFDSLNTTGEPLTAIETLKPLAIRFNENKPPDTTGYVQDEVYGKIIEYTRSEDPVKRQNESKELVILFALYIEGKKLSKSLNVQRSYLRERHNNLPNQAKNPFIASLADVATFRHQCWDKDGIDDNEAKFSKKHRDEIKLCLRFILDMKTSLAIPILCRYWSQTDKTNGGEDFLNALKAVTAFIVIRRAATGVTGGIDTVLRSLMEKEPTQFDGNPLSAGLGGKTRYGV